MSVPGPLPGCDQQPPTDGAVDLRVAVIGARRVRNGTGPFLARQAQRAGAKVEAVLGTRPASAREAVEELAADGISARAYVDYRELFEEVRPDAVIVATPVGTHRPWLQAALDAGAHVYCEKPLMTGPAERVKELARRFAAAELVLAENCQWPFVLPAFRRLHPDADLAAAGRFRMLLAPPMRGIHRWQETLSHPISLLQAAAPGPAVLEDIRFQEAGPEAPDARLDFRWRSLDRVLDCEVMLEDLEEWPRPAGFAFDDHECRRRIDVEDYGMRLEAEDAAGDAGGGEPPVRSVPLDDPMEAALRAFLVRATAVRRGEQGVGIDEDLVRRQALLEILLDSYRAQVRHGTR